MSDPPFFCIGLSLCLLGVTLLGCAESTLPTESSPEDSIATAAPGSELFLAPIDTTANSLEVGEAQRLTERPGYDNQPAFTPDGTAFFWISIRDGQADIYRRSLVESSGDEGSETRLTHTPVSEFSPTPLEAGGMSVVRVEDDGRQRLWRYTTQGAPVDPIFADVDSVGYHAWLDQNRVALFMLGSPTTLDVRNLRTGRDTTVASNIGRSLQPIPGRSAVSFIQIEDDSTTAVHLLDGASLDPRRLTATPGDQTGDYHAWTPAGTLLMGEGSSIQAWSVDEDEWSTVASYDTLDVSRLAVAPAGNRLIFVAPE